jgi:Putative citrate transport
MVKSIAEQSHVRVPHFMEYVMYYSLPILGPIFIVIWFLFFRWAEGWRYPAPSHRAYGQDKEQK